jgi:hypothetical protein
MTDPRRITSSTRAFCRVAKRTQKASKRAEVPPPLWGFPHAAVGNGEVGIPVAAALLAHPTD